MQMYECPKFDPPKGKACSAPICPLLPSVSTQSMGNGERVCYFLCEYQKANSETVFKVLGLEKLYEAIHRAMEEINSSCHTDPYLLRALKLAANSSSRMEKGILLLTGNKHG